MKKLLFAAVLAVFGHISINAQEKEYEVEIDEDNVLLNGKVILKQEKISSLEVSFFSLNDDEIISFRHNNNGSIQNLDDDYLIINFLQQKTKVETTNRSRVTGIGGYKKWVRKFVTWLLKDKVLNEDGTLNPEKIEIFYNKFNEDVTLRTVRY